MTNQTFKDFGRYRLFGFLPIPVVVAVVFLVLAHIVLTYTTFGTNVYALGSNEVAAQLSGINVKRTKLCVFMISGFTAAIGGLIMSARLGSGQSTMGRAGRYGYGRLGRYRRARRCVVASVRSAARWWAF